jgi:23S rRNA (cytidine1920-2'-O)/16S rRNA (cytidine1409-2'-O)-methyltransferase
VELAVADLSFISLRKVIEPCFTLLADGADLLPLYKPQFELGRRHVKKGGLALNFELHAEALIEFSAWVETLGLYLVDIVHAPIRGRRRNVEYMLHLTRESSSPGDIMSIVLQRVEEARTEYGKIED